MKVNNSYTPMVGERVLISPPNSDYESGYVYQEYNVLWMNDVFILYGNDGCWPNLNKIEHVHIKSINSQDSTKAEAMSEYTATYKTSMQISPDDWLVFYPTLKLTDETTVKEIRDWFKGKNTNALMEVRINELETK